MTKQHAYWLLAIGLGLQAVDVFTAKGASGGAIFGDAGILSPIDRKVPKVVVPWVGVETNLASWLILLGVIVWLWKR